MGGIQGIGLIAGYIFMAAMGRALGVDEKKRRRKREMMPLPLGPLLDERLKLIVQSIQD